MAYSIVPTPGDMNLCADLCKHKDCSGHRKTLRTLCVECRAPMKSGDKVMYHSLDGAPIHAACLLAKVEGK